MALVATGERRRLTRPAADGPALRFLEGLLAHPDPGHPDFGGRRPGSAGEGRVPAALTVGVSLLLKRQWLPKSKMVPLGIDETIDKLKMMEGRNSSIRKAVRVAFDRAMNHLSRVHGEPASDLSDID